MSIEFSELIICLLPGFLGLWVFKRIVQEDIDKRGEFTQVAIALLLAISAFFFLALLHGALVCSAFIAPWISPEALSLSHIKGSGIFNVTPEFWVSYGALCFFALISGGFWAFLSEKGWSPTRFLSHHVISFLGRGPQEVCESALRALVDEMSAAKQGPYLVKVYLLGENQGRPLFGLWGGYSETEKEINLTQLEICDSDPELDRLLLLQPRRCWINHNSGVVVEFLELDEGKQKKLYNRLCAKYNKKKNGNVPSEHSKPDQSSSDISGGSGRGPNGCLGS